MTATRLPRSAGRLSMSLSNLTAPSLIPQETMRSLPSFSTTIRLPARRHLRSPSSVAPAESKSGGTAPVLTSSLSNRRAPRSRLTQFDAQTGVTILEMVVAMMVLMVGLLALAASIGYAVMVSNKGRNLTNTKLLVVSVLEQMETLRNTQELTFGQIANTGQVDNTGSTKNFPGFPTGFQP